MKQQPDNLFREKLEDFRMTAPANAWSRIETGLDKTSQKGLWLKIAAGLVLLSVATVLIWNSIKVNENNIVASQSVTEKPEQVLEEQPNTIGNNETANQTVVVQGDISTSQKTKSVQKKTAKEKFNSSNSVSNEVAMATQVEPIAEASVAEVAQNIIPVESAETPAGVYLSYSADEVNEKYLLKQPVDDATLEEKKPSRMQRLMAVAHNITTSDNGIGDLRQVKDEIFALNFIDEKKRQQKKTNGL